MPRSMLELDVPLLQDGDGLDVPGHARFEHIGVLIG